MYAICFPKIHQFAKLKHRIAIFGMQTHRQAGGCRPRKKRKWDFMIIWP